MKLTRALIAGVIGATVMSFAMLLLRLTGIPVSLEPLLGSLAISEVGTGQWIVGFLIHLAIGACAAIAYAVVFEWACQQAGPVVGAGLGLCHGLLAGLLMSGIPAMNPLEVSGRLAAPGPFLYNLPLGPILFILLHVIFGACVGTLYGPTIQHAHMYTNLPGKHV